MLNLIKNIPFALYIRMLDRSLFARCEVYMYIKKYEDNLRKCAARVEGDQGSITR